MLAVDRYTIGNAEGKATTVLLASHTQHDWSESWAWVSTRVLTRVKRELGDGPYTNPEGNFGQAQVVHLGVK